MKVLLISPLPELDPPCGDVTYTQMLLAYPPEGVQYETYAQAVQRGSLREHASKRSLLASWREKKGFWSELGLTVFNRAINQARRWHWLFWEPSRFFSVKAGEYDLIHLNVFNACFYDAPCPIIVSNAAPVRYLYTQARKYSMARVKALEWTESILAKLFGVNLVSYRLPAAARIIAFTHYLKQWYVDRGIKSADAIDVVPVCLSSPPAAQTSGRAQPKTIGFMSKDFEARGGPFLLEAFELVRKQRPDAELVIRSEDGGKYSNTPRENVTWLPYLAREKLMTEVLPSFDVYAYPTEFDGFYSLVEAMSFGIACVTSDYQAMPEFVDHGQAGLISPVRDAPALATNILKLLQPEANRHYREAAREKFEQCYSVEAVQPMLRRAYDKALQG